jgi:hypothetical protein
MEAAVRALNLLLILVFVFQGLCAVPEIGKRHPLDIPIPDFPIPIPIPDIPVDPIPVPKVDPIPIPIPKCDPIPNWGSNGPSLLGNTSTTITKRHFQVQYSALPTESTPLTEG